MDTAVMQQRAATGAGWANTLLGIWVVLSPFVLGYGRSHAAMWSNVAVGLVIILLSLASQSGHETLVQAVIVPLGVWLFISAFVLRFSSVPLFWNNVVMSFLIIAGVLVTEGLRQGTFPGEPPET
jgi:SPW repeat